MRHFWPGSNPGIDYAIQAYMRSVWPALNATKFSLMCAKLRDALYKSRIDEYLHMNHHLPLDPHLAGDSIPPYIVEIIVTHMRLTVAQGPDFISIGTPRWTFSRAVDPAAADARSLRAALCAAIRMSVSYELNQVSSQLRPMNTL